jgi:hypothetical protein
LFSVGAVSAKLRFQSTDTAPGNAASKKSSGEMSGLEAAAALAAFLSAVFLLGVPRWRPPRLSPGFDPLGIVFTFLPLEPIDAL